MPRCLLALLLALTACPGAKSAQFARNQDPWGRFEPGAWKLVRVVTETFDEGRPISSMYETKTTLNRVGEKDVTLLVQASVQVAGKQFEPDPHEVQQDFSGELADQPVKITELGPVVLDIQGQAIPCTIRR